MMNRNKLIFLMLLIFIFNSCFFLNNGQKYYKSKSKVVETTLDSTLLVNTGQIIGFVFDALSGDPLPNIDIEVKNTTYITKSNNTGQFNLLLPIGNYDLFLNGKPLGQENYIAKISLTSQTKILIHVFLGGTYIK